MSKILSIDIVESPFGTQRSTFCDLNNHLFILTGCCLDNEIFSLWSITGICRAGQRSKDMGFKECL